MFEMLKWFFMPPLYLGILDIGGKKGKSKTESSERFQRSKDVESQQTKTQEQIRTGTETTQLTEQQQTELLSEEVRTGVEDLIAAIGGQATGDFQTAGDIAQLGRFLTDRAAGAEAAIGEQTAGIVGEARRTGEQDIQRTLTSLLQATGGGQSSLIAQLGLEARGDLETRLAGLASELGIAARGAATEEFGAALSALAGAPQAQAAGAGVGNVVANLVGALKGAQATTTRTGETAVATEDVLSALERLIGSEQTTERGFSEGKSKTKSKGGGFGISI